MEKISLQDGFTLKVLGENVYHIPEEEIEAKVPGTVYGTLLDKGLMPDPYFGENELTATKLMENDFEYRKEFFVTEEMTAADGLYLVFEGIDTLSDIYLNEEKIGSTDNMHRTYSFDVLERLKIGENVLQVVLHSPIRYIKEENEKIYRQSAYQKGTFDVWMGLGSQTAGCRYFPSGLSGENRKSQNRQCVCGAKSQGW